MTFTSCRQLEAQNKQSEPRPFRHGCAFG